jgi:hypothetical protein
MISAKLFFHMHVVFSSSRELLLVTQFLPKGR